MYETIVFVYLKSSHLHVCSTLYSLVVNWSSALQDQCMSPVAIYPENAVDIDATGRSRIVQLEPLVQAKARIRQQTGQRDRQTAQRLHTVCILNLVDITERKERPQLKKSDPNQNDQTQAL